MAWSHSGADWFVVRQVRDKMFHANSRMQFRGRIVHVLVRRKCERQPTDEAACGRGARFQ